MGLFGGSTKTTTTSNPWAPQGDALKSIFSSAGSLYDQQSGTPWYQGDLYASMDPATAQAIQGMLSYVNGRGANSADRLTNAGASLTDPANYQSAIDRFSAASGADPTQSNIAAATAYANNPAIDGMVDAASRDVSRNLYEQAIPGINQAASGTGNINSSRAGVAEGIARRGAQDMIGDISSNIRGDAYSQGLSLAEQGRQANLSGMGQAAGLYGQSFGQGMAALNGGNDMTLGNSGAAIDASQLYQQDAQGQLDADYAKWQGNDTRQWDLLNNYYNIIGANNWGGTSTSKTKTSGSVLGSVLGAASVAGGLGLFGGGK